MTEYLTPQQVKTLEALAEFQYLTAKQLQFIGVSKSLQVLREQVLRRLWDTHHPFVKYKDFGLIPGYGRLPRVHFLTKRGAHAVADYRQRDPSEIPYPKGGLQYTNDFFHRVDFVDFHICLSRWAEATGIDVSFFHAYFHYLGAQRGNAGKLVCKTRVLLDGKLWLKPDGVFRFIDAKGDPRLCALEVHRGDNTKRITEQLDRHVSTISQGLLSDKHDHRAANFVLSVHEHQTTLDRSRERLMRMEDFKAFVPLFRFNTTARVRHDITQGWVLATGEGTPFFV